MRFYEASAKDYGLNALLAVLDTDGEKMLSQVLSKLGLARSLDLICAISKKR